LTGLTVNGVRLLLRFAVLTEKAVKAVTHFTGLTAKMVELYLLMT
jgi:hypothetical protein